MEFFRKNKVFVFSCLGAMIFFGLLIASLVIEDFAWFQNIAGTGLLICVVLEYLFKPFFQRKD